MLARFSVDLPHLYRDPTQRLAMMPKRDVAVALSALAFAACSDVVGPDVEYIDVSVTVSASEMVPGDTIQFRVVASNSTERTLRFNTNSCVLLVRLIYGAGYTVFQDPTTCNDIGLTHELGPGSSIEATWNFDGSSSWGPFLDELGNEATNTLAPGAYQVVGGISAAFLNPSNPVELQIRPKS